MKKIILVLLVFGFTAAGAANIITPKEGFVLGNLTHISGGNEDEKLLPKGHLTNAVAASNFTKILAVFTVNGSTVSGGYGSWHAGIDFTNASELITANLDLGKVMTNFQPGAVIYTPLILKKHMDRATPLLADALIKNYQVNMEVYFLGNHPSNGSEEVKFKYTLTNARLIGLTHNELKLDFYELIETLRFTYETMVIEDYVNSTAVSIQP
ncbi:type VI secretion system tube protein Hcp [uncultured Arcticibacterium sp.]|uniref:type VI secretion system tube protein Hcp n=1 Tax=uncultured Arcticibacterium sp. TaxID=2173042 RepID=UPI0030FCE50A